jgi:CRP/FNR family transcriptional regulator, cyclic AMP receptor protein
MVDSHTLEPILKSHPFFADMEPAHIGLLAGCAANVRFEPGQYIMRLGEDANKFYVIREGRVAAEITPPGRGSIIIETLADGDLLGWSWLFPPYKWNLTARALETVRAIGLDAACLRGKLDQDHELGYEVYKRFAKIMQERFTAMREQLMAQV